MNKTLTIMMSLLTAFTIAGVTDSQTAVPAMADAAAATARNSLAAADSIPGRMAADDTNNNDDTRAGTTARRRPSPNLRQRPMTPPPAPAPSPPPGRGVGLGRFFGGVAAGALLGTVFSSMLHPFGGFGTGFTLIGLLLDAILLYLAFKLFRRLANRNYGR